MRTLIETVSTTHTPETLATLLRDEDGLVVLRTAMFDVESARYSIITAWPFLKFRSVGSRCETIHNDGRIEEQFGNPWAILRSLAAGYELLDEVDLPFPLGGVFGFWGYDLKHFVEPRLSRHAVHDLELPDCSVGFYGSLVIFDHRLGKVSVVSTGLSASGEWSEERARAEADVWKRHLQSPTADLEEPPTPPTCDDVRSSFTREAFVENVRRAQAYILAGDIYQVNLARRIDAPWPGDGLDFFRRLLDASPSPFAAFLADDGFSIASSSPELFLRMSGSHAITRPIKGTRPRSDDPVRDAQLMYELQRSEKEMSELVMITDLLRNDLGRVSEYGSVQVPELVRLERFAQVQHLVSTVEGRMRDGLTHLDVLESCFPGGSITGAPKIRAMEIIDELEPVARGPYTGCIGYLGFNRESQLSIAIRTAVIQDGRAWFHVGAGIVADSIPEAEYDETSAKARGLLSALTGKQAGMNVSTPEANG